MGPENGHASGFNIACLHSIGALIIRIRLPGTLYHNHSTEPPKLYRQINSLLQQPGHKKFKLSKIELIYKAKQFKVAPFTKLIRSLYQDSFAKRAELACQEGNPKSLQASPKGSFSRFL